MHRWIQALKAQPHAAPIADEGLMRRQYRAWRLRTMYSMMLGYAAFYLVRKNFSMAMPAFLEEFHLTKTDLGLILSLFSAVYGIGKWCNGVVADRANPRYFLAIGLIGSAIMNVLFGFSSGLVAFGIFWILNAWFQSMGWPPCARLLTHWYSPRELGTKWGIWNASHQIGGAGILLLGGVLVSSYGWRSAFFVPAIIAAAVALVVIERLRDTPQSLGLPPVEVYRGELRSTAEDEDTAATFRDILVNHVLRNRLVWCVALANFFVYIVRIGVLDWAPTFLVEAKGSTLSGAGAKVASFEIAGIFGALAAGILSDRLFGGRRGPANVLFMVALAGCMLFLWKVPPGHPWLDAAALMAVGFLVYGPQMLVGVAAADFASKKAAATATGMTGAFGYLGSCVCGLGTGWIVDRFGWDGGFAFFLTAALLGVLLFLLTWKARPVALEGPSCSPSRAETA